MKNLFVYFSLLWANLYNLLTKKPSSYLKMEPLRACVVVVVWVILRSGDPSRCQASSRPSFGFASGKGLPQLTYLSPIQSQSLSTQRCCWGCWSCGYRCVAVVVVVKFFFFNFLLMAVLLSLNFSLYGVLIFFFSKRPNFFFTFISGQFGKLTLTNSPPFCVFAFFGFGNRIGFFGKTKI